MTTIELSGGSFGSEKLLVRCNLAEASSPIEANYCNGEGWQPTQYQCADARHRNSGLIEIGKQLAAVALEVPMSEFSCESEEVE